MDYHRSIVHEDFELAFKNNHEFIIGDVGYSRNELFCFFEFPFQRVFFLTFFRISIFQKPRKKPPNLCHQNFSMEV